MQINSQDTLQTQLFQEQKVLLLRKTASVDPSRDHVEVIRWAKVLRVGEGFAYHARIHSIHRDGPWDGDASRHNLMR